MDTDQSSQLNPYAPTTLEVDSADSDAFPEMGIDFAGVLDVHSVRKTHRVTLAVGASICFAFVALLLVGLVNIPTAASMVVLLTAAVAVGITLVAFAYGQTVRPLLKFDWMQGPIDGTLKPDRLDVRWNDGESEGSFAFSKPNSDQEFHNRHGRLFVIRNMSCFIPKNAVPTNSWPAIKSFRPKPTDQCSLRQPPVPNRDTAKLWNDSGGRFSDNRVRHDFLCAEPGFSRAVCLLAIATLFVLFLIDHRTTGHTLAKIAAATASAFAAFFWISREAMRRNWWSSNLDYVPAIRWHRPTERSPEYVRWIDADRLLVGFHDAWICVPWSAINSATISPYAMQFSFTPLGLDAWYLERGNHTDDQWQQTVHFVQSKTIDVSLWGTVRR